MAQTSDGYMWLATPDGIQRFDGISSKPWPPKSRGVLAEAGVRALLGSRDGTLWIGTTKGLFSLVDGRLVDHPAFRGRTINDLEDAGDGTLWVGGSANKQGLLCSIRARAAAVSRSSGRNKIQDLRAARLRLAARSALIFSLKVATTSR